MNKVIFPGKAHDSALFDGKPPKFYLSNQNLLRNTSLNINQRGQAEYVGNKYHLDGWLGYTNTQSVQIRDGYITLSELEDKSGPLAELQQKLEDPSSYSGRLVTMAAEIRRNVNTRDGGITLRLRNSIGTLFQSVIPGDDWTTVVYTALIPDGDATYFRVAIAFRDHANSVDIRRVKLEFGPLFTGWHSEDPASELLKCQRYYQVHDRGDIAPENLSPPMRVAPVVRQRPDGLWEYDAEL